MTRRATTKTPARENRPRVRLAPAFVGACVLLLAAWACAWCSSDSSALLRGAWSGRPIESVAQLPLSDSHDLPQATCGPDHNISASRPRDDRPSGRDPGLRGTIADRQGTEQQGTQAGRTYAGTFDAAAAAARPTPPARGPPSA